MCWIIEDVICIGFETGLILCFNLKGIEIFEYKAHNSSVISMHLGYAIVRDSKVPSLWVLYEHGILISVLIF